MKMASLFHSVRSAGGALVSSLALGFAPAVPGAFAQELLPELAAPAAQHKAADEALEKQKLEAIAVAAKSYVSTLDSIEKTATAKGEIDLVAAVVKEREAAASGTLEPNLPAALPKARLQMSRKSLLASLERINADFAKRKKRADADYLRVLATLQPKAASNPGLAKQLAAEKTALLEGGNAGSGNGSPVTDQPRGKNVVVNGDFEKLIDGMPEGWEDRSRKGGVSVETEDGNKFIRIENKKNNDGVWHGLTQEVDVPPGSKEMVASVRLRTKDCVSFRGISPYIKVVVKGQDEGERCEVIARSNGKNRRWETIMGKENVPNGAVKAWVEVKDCGCPGQIDFDDVEVTFK